MAEAGRDDDPMSQERIIDEMLPMSLEMENAESDIEDYPDNTIKTEFSTVKTPVGRTDKKVLVIADERGARSRSEMDQSITSTEYFRKGQQVEDGRDHKSQPRKTTDTFVKGVD